VNNLPPNCKDLHAL